MHVTSGTVWNCFLTYKYFLQIITCIRYIKRLYLPFITYTFVSSSLNFIWKINFLSFKCHGRNFWNGPQNNLDPVFFASKLLISIRNNYKWKRTAIEIVLELRFFHDVFSKPNQEILQQDFLSPENEGHIGDHVSTKTTNLMIKKRTDDVQEVCKKASRKAFSANLERPIKLNKC